MENYEPTIILENAACICNFKRDYLVGAWHGDFQKTLDPLRGEGHPSGDRLYGRAAVAPERAKRKKESDPAEIEMHPPG